jgi:hypothetical protein
MLRILALALAGALVFSGSAYAGSNSNGITGSISPKTKNAPVTESFNLTNNYAGGLVPDIAYQSTISTPNEVLNGKYFPSCSVAQVTPPSGDSACAKALIGSGTATAAVVACGTHPSEAQTSPIHFTIKIFNGPGGHSLVSKLKGVELSGVVGVFPVTINTGSGGDTFAFSLSDSLLSPVAGTCAPIEAASFKIDKKTVKVKKGKLKGKKVGIVQNAKKCKGKFAYANLYTDGSRDSSNKLTRTQIDQASSSSKGC